MHLNLKTILDSMTEGVLIFEKGGNKEVLYRNEKVIELLELKNEPKTGIKSISNELV